MFVPGAEANSAALLPEMDRLREKIEYEKQPNIAFEKENDQLQQQVNFFNFYQ